MGTHKTIKGIEFIVDDYLDKDVSKYTWEQDTAGYIRRRTYNKGKRGHCSLSRWVLEFPDGYVDHINRNKLDNRIDNLRVVTNAENMWNVPYIGVDQIPSGKWRARITINNKRKTIGCFKTKEEAEEAYKVEWKKRLALIADI